MTNETAFNVIASIIELNLVSVELTEGVREALMIALKSIDKQIPKKVRIEHNIPRYGYASFCPKCNRMDVGLFHCCPTCGQALDWRIEK